MRSLILLVLIPMGVLACAPAQPATGATPPPAATRPPSGAAAVATTAPSPAAAPIVPPAPATVRLGLMYSASDAGLLIALERGYYREQGIEVELEQFGAAAQMLGPLGAAQIDAGGTAITPGFLNAFARGVRVRVVADKGSTEPGWGYQGIAIRRPLWDAGTVRGPADLRGRKVAIPSVASSAEVGLDRGLRLGGIGVREVDLTQLSFPDMPPALASGAIDGALIIEPFLTRVEADGTAVVWKREDEYYPNHQIALMYYSEPFATERAEVARRFMVAYLRGTRDYNDGFRRGDSTRRQEAIAALVKHTTVKDPALYERMAMPALHPDGEIHIESLRENYEYWVANGYQEERVTITDLVDSSFIRFAQQQLGPYR